MKTLLLSPAREMNTPAIRLLNVVTLEEDKEMIRETPVSEPALFTASNMWNRHRNMRSASDLVRKWSLN